MRADRRIDPAGTSQLAGLDFPDDLLVQGLPHSVQALEFVLTRRIGRWVCHFIYCGERVRVVGRELRIDRIGCPQQLAGTGEVRHVGIGLARIHRVALEAIDLRSLDFAVPVGALHQANHQAMAAAPREIDDEVDDVGAALLVRLDHEADAVPP